jgi:hypothetical protein
MLSFLHYDNSTLQKTADDILFQHLVTNKKLGKYSDLLVPKALSKEHHQIPVQYFKLKIAENENFSS